MRKLKQMIRDVPSDGVCYFSSLPFPPQMEDGPVAVAR